MSLKLINNDSFYGFRSRRSINGVVHQKYYSLKKNGKKIVGKEKEAIRKEALAYDKELEQKQKEHKRQRESEFKHLRNSWNNTGVRGIQIINKSYSKHGKNYTSLCFSVSCVSRLVNKPVATSISIDEHGYKKAWEKAVGYLAKHKNIEDYDYLIDRFPKFLEKHL